jgi:chromosome partitioning protein
VASDAVLIPVLPEYQPVVGAEQTFQTVSMVQKRLNPALKHQRFLFTMVDGRKKNHRAYREYLRGKYGSTVMSAIVRTCTSLSLSSKSGSTIFDADVLARGAIDYANVADEWLRIIPDGQQPAASHVSTDVSLTPLDPVSSDLPRKESHFRPLT